MIKTRIQLCVVISFQNMKKIIYDLKVMKVIISLLFYINN